MAKETKEKFLKIASELLLKYGYAGTSIADISRACGTSKATFYHHFKSKEGMLEDVVNFAVENNNKILLITVAMEVAHQEGLKLIAFKIHRLLFPGGNFNFMEIGALVHTKLLGVNP